MSVLFWILGRLYQLHTKLKFCFAYLPMVAYEFHSNSVMMIMAVLVLSHH